MDWLAWASLGNGTLATIGTLAAGLFTGLMWWNSRTSKVGIDCTPIWASNAAQTWIRPRLAIRNFDRHRLRVTAVRVLAPAGARLIDNQQDVPPERVLDLLLRPVGSKDEDGQPEDAAGIYLDLRAPPHWQGGKLRIRVDLELGGQKLRRRSLTITRYVEPRPTSNA